MTTLALEINPHVLAPRFTRVPPARCNGISSPSGCHVASIADHGHLSDVAGVLELGQDEVRDIGARNPR